MTMRPALDACAWRMHSGGSVCRQAAADDSTVGLTLAPRAFGRESGRGRRLRRPGFSFDTVFGPLIHSALVASRRGPRSACAPASPRGPSTRPLDESPVASLTARPTAAALAPAGLIRREQRLRADDQPARAPWATAQDLEDQVARHAQELEQPAPAPGAGSGRPAEARCLPAGPDDDAQEAELGAPQDRPREA